MRTALSYIAALAGFMALGLAIAGLCGILGCAPKVHIDPTLMAVAAPADTATNRKGSNP